MNRKSHNSLRFDTDSMTQIWHRYSETTLSKSSSCIFTIHRRKWHHKSVHNFCSRNNYALL